MKQRQIANSQESAQSNSLDASSGAEPAHTTTDNDHVLNRLLELSSKIVTVAAQNPDQQQLDELVSDVRQALIEIDAKVGNGRLIPLAQSITDVVLRIESLYGNGESCSSPIMVEGNGYIDFDVFSACLNPGSLTVVAGTTGVGKTAFAIQIAVHAASASSRKPIAIFNMSQSGRVIAERLLSSISMLEVHKFRSGQFDGNDWERLTHGLKFGNPNNLWLYDSGSIGIDGLQTLCREKNSETGALGLVIIDDLQCIQDRNSDWDPDAILRSLKAMALELYVPIVVISHLFDPCAKRDDRFPRLSDLQNCDAISITADMVLLIHRDKHRLSASKRLSNAEVIVALHKGGPTGTVPFFFDNKNLSFRSRGVQEMAASEIARDGVGQVPTDIGVKGSPCDEKLMPLMSLLERSVYRMERIYEEGKKNAPPSDINNDLIDLDVFTAGLNPGSLTVVAGAPGVGKTAFALHMVEHVIIKEAKPVAIFCMRQSGWMIAERLLSFFGPLDIHVIRTGDFCDNDWGRLTQGLGRAAGSDVRICDSVSIGGAELRALCCDMSSRSGLGLVVIDDLQCIHDANVADKNSAAMTLRSLNEMARELNVPVVVLSNLSQPQIKHPDGRPRLFDLADYDAISQEVDLVFLIHRDANSVPASKNPCRAEVIVAMHRGGPTGTVPLLFDAKYLRFRDPIMRFNGKDIDDKFAQLESERFFSNFGETGTKH